MSQTLLDEVIANVVKLAPSERERTITQARRATRSMVWVPNPGPQTAAFECQADELGYGGEAGGGKSSLIVGLSLTAHRRSLLLRRTNKEADKFVSEYEEVLGTKNGWNGKGTWNLPGGRTIDLGGCEHEKDKQKRKGTPHDLIAFDQVEDFTETQYTFIIGWNRSTTPGQRSRVVANFNPPTRPEGLWVIRRWGPWLDPRHPRPAKPGELRWFTNIDGKDTEVDGPGPHMVDGKPVMAKSRTFIRAHLSDNPDLARTNYHATLAALPKELRAAYEGGKFEESLRDTPFQIIPTAWVREAQMRWEDRPPAGVPMCAIGADMSGGGDDPMVIGYRHDGWFGSFTEIPGREIPMDAKGRYEAGLIVMHRRDQAVVVIDMGGGYGGAAYEHLKTTTSIEVIAFKGSEASVRRTHDHQLGFKNKRTEALWRFREALDPGQAGGSPIMLPDDPELVADLTSVTYHVIGSTIVAESKEDVILRLGRSTNRGDTAVMTWSAGPTASTDGAIWDEQRRQMRPMGRRPEVKMGRYYARR